MALSSLLIAWNLLGVSGYAEPSPQTATLALAPSAGTDAAADGSTTTGAAGPADSTGGNEVPTDIAEASSLTAVVLPMFVEGTMPDSDRTLLEARLIEGLDRGGFAVIAPETLRADGVSTAACQERGCVEEIGRRYNATHVVRGLVSVEDRDYGVTIELADVAASGDVIATSSQSCEICGPLDAAGLVETSAAVLRNKLDALALGPTTMIATSEPEGAVVRVDGEIVGTTPLERALPAGKHIVRVEAEGYIALEREVVFVEGAQEQVDFTLDPLPSVLPAARWGWASLSVGLLALGGGGVLTAVDRRPQEFRCSEAEGTKDRDGDCKYLWNTRWFGASAMAVGGGLVTLGIVVLVESRLRKSSGQVAWRRSPRQPRISVGPAGLRVFGKF